MLDTSAAKSLFPTRAGLDFRVRGCDTVGSYHIQSIIPSKSIQKGIHLTNPRDLQPNTTTTPSKLSTEQAIPQWIPDMKKGILVGVVS